MKHAFILCTALTMLAAPAAAVVINGDTTGGPVWNRTVSGSPPTALSGVGTAVRYEVTQFTVSAAGLYTFNSTAGYDNYLHLYQTSFNPLSQFTNLLIANDDNPLIGTSGFNFALATGVNYFAVASSFANTDFGAYQLSITGPGDVTVGGAVPEPSSWALLIAGFGLTGAVSRRRRRVTA